MISFNICQRATKFAEGLDAKQYKQVWSKIHSLLREPRPHDAKKVTGYDSLLRVDIGEYRIIYIHTGQTVTVSFVGKRNDDEVYKDLARNYLSD